MDHLYQFISISFYSSKQNINLCFGEYKTTVVCNGCGEELDKIPDRDDEPAREITLNYVEREEPELYASLQNDLDRGLRVCLNTSCFSQFTHRDGNAARNMAWILYHRLMDGNRPPFFLRQPK